MKVLPQWIDGKEIVGNAGQSLPVTNPATGQTIAELPLSSTEDLTSAVRAAERAQKQWATVSLGRRMDVMYKMRSLILDHQAEIARAIVEEHGKDYSDALGEIQRGRETLDFACGISTALKGEYSSNISSGVDIHTVHQPVGVVAGICPFNFPIMVPMWMHPIALATGNAFILKPASTVPTASLLIARLYQQAGLPDGLFNVVYGEKEIVTEILEHPGVNAVSFVGSTSVAKIVQSVAVANGKRVQALGGANNHAIVMPDIELEFAAKHIASAAFGAAGERCMALPTVVAVGNTGERLAELIREFATGIKVGSGLEDGVQMGPVITAEAKKRITDLIDDAEARGAHVVLDGRNMVVPGYEDGYFMGPTIVTETPLDSNLYQQEIFGPVLVIVQADSFEAALNLVNAQPVGNGAAIFTNDGGTARQFELEVEAGMVGVNVPIPTPVAYYSFGGWKDSLMGDIAIHGPSGVRFYTRTKAVTSRWITHGDSAAATMSFQRQE